MQIKEGIGWKAATDAILMMREPSVMYGRQIWQSAATARQFKSIMFRLSASGVSSVA